MFCLLKVNKRLDEWVTPDRLDIKKLQFPKKEAKTPMKDGLPGSRPSSPERDVVRGSTLHPVTLDTETALPHFTARDLQYIICSCFQICIMFRLLQQLQEAKPSPNRYRRSLPILFCQSICTARVYDEWAELKTKLNKLMIHFLNGVRDAVFASS